MPLFAAFITFIIILLLAGSVALYATQRRDPDVAGRLKEIAENETREASEQPLNLVRDEMLSAVPLLDRLLIRWPGSRLLKLFLAQAGWKIRPGKLMLFSAVGVFAGYLAASFLIPSIFALIVGGAIGAAPLAFAAFKRVRRFHSFEKQFPEAIELLARAVRAGHAFTSGMEMISTELVEPIGAEFRITSDEQNLGLPLRDALMHQIDRVPLADVRFFVSSLLIQKESGGNLAELLDNLSKVIRERFRIQGEVRVRTAQGRLTAGILFSLPPIVFVLLMFLNSDYASLLFTDRMGRLMLAGAALLQLIGGMMLWKIVQVDV